MSRTKRPIEEVSNFSSNTTSTKKFKGEDGEIKIWKKVKTYVWDKLNLSRPRPPLAPVTSKSRKNKDQQEGGGFIYNSNKSTRLTNPSTTTTTTTQTMISPRKAISIDRGGSIIDRLPPKFDSQRQINNNNKSNLFSTTTTSTSSKPHYSFSTLSKPMKVMRPPPLYPSTPDTAPAISRTSSNTTIPSPDEIEWSNKLSDWKWNVAIAKSGGKELPKYPERPHRYFSQKRPMGSHSLSQLERTERDLQKRNAEMRYQSVEDQGESLEAYRMRVDESIRADDIRNSFETSENLPSSILRRHTSIKPPRPLLSGLDKTLRTAKETANAPKPVKPILENYEALMRAAEELARSLDLQTVKRRKYPKALSNDDQDRVSAILRETGVISTTTGAEVLDKDIRNLRGLSWLNDEVITFYAIMINSRSNRIEKEGTEREKKEFRNCYSFTSFFYAKLSTDGHKGVARWTKKVDLFAKEKVIIPINQGNRHWVCAAIDISKKRFEFYDSLGTRSTSVFKRLREYLATEHLERKKTVLDLSDWTDHWDPDSIPQQANGCDCGVFTCQFMESLSRKVEKFDFTQAEMPYLRNRMILDIKDQKIREEEWA